MEPKITVSSRFDYNNSPKKASILAAHFEGEFKNSDVYTSNTLYIKYLEIEIKYNGSSSYYDIYLNLGKSKILSSNGSLDNPKEEKNLSDPHFLIRDRENTLNIQLPFEDLDDITEYLTQLTKGEVLVF